MRQGQLIDITGERNLNTSESYSSDGLLFDDTWVLPIINLDITDKTILDNKERVRVEFAYLILIDVSEISWMGERRGSDVIGTMTVRIQDSQITDWLSYCKEDESYELKVKYRRLLIYIPTISRFGQEWWAPWDTPVFKKNIDKKSLENFADLELLPEEVRSELKIDIDSATKLEFRNGTGEQVRLIKANWSEAL